MVTAVGVDVAAVSLFGGEVMTRLRFRHAAGKVASGSELALASAIIRLMSICCFLAVPLLD
jgi:hypothetical protein